MQKYLLGILTLILLACCVWMFTTLFEQYDEEVDAGYSQEALLNPYLAAQQFLKQNEVKVLAKTSVLDFSLISPDDTVFLSEVDSMLLTESQINKAINWVEQGGFLIIGIGKETEGHDSLLKRFDIEPSNHKHATSKADESSTELSENLTEALNNLVNLNEHPTYTIPLADDRGEIKLQVLDNIVLNHPDLTEDKAHYKKSLPYKLTAEEGDDVGVRLLQFNYGKGSFVALSSAKLWQNKHIGEADHAFLLAYFVPKGSSLHFFYDVTAPSLLTLLQHYFFELLVACSALLLLWLWRASLRVEGLKMVTEGQRRVFTEHLTASAEFLASKKQYQALLMPIKEDITAQMRLFHPGFTQLDMNAQTALIAQRAEIPEKTVQTWVDYTNQVNNQDELIEALKLGNAIRRKL